jgi:hypothetical protein
VTIPDRVIGIKKIFRLENPEVAYDDVRFGLGFDQAMTTVGGGEIEGVTPRATPKPRNGRIDLLSGATVYHDVGTGVMKRMGNRKTNAFC